MQIIIDLLLIQFIITGIIDVSGFIGEIEHSLSKWLKIKAKIPKPFSCATCMTFWTGLIYLLITANLSLLTISLTLFIALMTTVTSGFIILVRDLFLKIITIIEKYLR